MRILNVLMAVFLTMAFLTATAGAGEPGQEAKGVQEGVGVPMTPIAQGANPATAVTATNSSQPMRGMSGMNGMGGMGCGGMMGGMGGMNGMGGNMGSMGDMSGMNTMTGTQHSMNREMTMRDVATMLAMQDVVTAVRDLTRVQERLSAALPPGEREDVGKELARVRKSLEQLSSEYRSQMVGTGGNP